MSGKVSYLAGFAAEEQVAQAYRVAGYRLIADRWRSGAGEIDLIVRNDACTVFVEVKRARDFATAAERITPRQMARIRAAAEIWLGSLPGGTDSEARIDVALVDGRGQVEILENVLAA